MNDPRYHPQRWTSRSRQTRKLTCDRCVLCFDRATEVHHAYYGFGFWHFRLPIPGYEMPLWQCFPLCDKCHSNSKGCAHNLKQYQIHADKWRNRNTYRFIWRLRSSTLLTLLLFNRTIQFWALVDGVLIALLIRASWNQT